MSACVAKHARLERVWTSKFFLFLRPFWQKQSRSRAIWLAEYCIQFLSVQTLISTRATCRCYMVGRTVGGVTASEMVRRDCWKYISSLYNSKRSIDYQNYSWSWISYINLDLTLHNNYKLHNIVEWTVDMCRDTFVSLLSILLFSIEHCSFWGQSIHVVSSVNEYL